MCIRAIYIYVYATDPTREFYTRYGLELSFDLAWTAPRAFLPNTVFGVNRCAVLRDIRDVRKKL